MAIEVPIKRLEGWNNGEFRLQATADYVSTILVGEIHDRPPLIERQLELIELANPEYVLHECATGFSYNPNTRIWTRSDNHVPVAFSLAEAFVKHASRLGYSLIGCDLPLEEQQTLLDRLCDHWVSSEDSIDFTHPILNSRRESQMVSTIVEHRALTIFPLVVILGAAHVNNIHEQGLLQDKGISYALIDQSRKGRH